LKNPEISNLIKMRLVGAEFFHVDRQMDRHGNAHSWSAVLQPLLLLAGCAMFSHLPAPI